MPYIDGFVIAVPAANKQAFIDHANKGNPIFMELGATRILECWGDLVLVRTVVAVGHAVDVEAEHLTTARHDVEILAIMRGRREIGRAHV